ncbi:hypothetical protein BB559_001410 [Furculomyces boomerangus]|uniref:Beta-hexosaminidase n=2 Tax=Harpellales TaxID=61421 RepID=A0A2T9Z208_9FUNG|nr:hypothetical protein BB559_001410 [Furculomyces boomerangus]PWA03542.1 hypothetical protein BB558_000280 [Smittium angustum]
MVKISSLLVIGATIAQYSFASLWPIPKVFTTGCTNIDLPSSCLEITVDGCSNDILDRAIDRYTDLILNENFKPPLDYNIAPLQASGSVQGVTISVATENINLDLQTDESYTLTVSQNGTIAINAQSTFGAIRGLETLSQLFISNQGRKFIKNVPINIQDSPVFKHRGLMLDTSRNFYSIASIKRTLDAMSYSKMNVFRWHIVDSQSWPVESKFDPRLNALGAYGPDMIYTHKDVTDIISYARDRGIRVIPEFDMPGHTYIVGLSNPEIMSCLNFLPDWDKYAAEPPSGQLNIIKPGAYSFVNKLIAEYSSLFTDNVFHVGGDEVNLNCWEKDPDIMAYLAQNSTDSVKSILGRFYANIYANLKVNNKTGMCWEESLMEGIANPPKDTIIQAWIDPKSVVSAVEKGYRVVAAPYSYSYLDCGHGQWLSNLYNGTSWCDPFKFWGHIYSYNPYVNITTPEKRALVLGGEVNLWSEQSDDVIVDKMLWPRAAAAGELYWKGPVDENADMSEAVESASPRINEFRFRLLGRGINAEPTQPLWCVRNPGKCALPPS